MCTSNIQYAVLNPDSYSLIEMWGMATLSVIDAHPSFAECKYQWRIVIESWSLQLVHLKAVASTGLYIV
jgi:hypothetical protein